MITGNHGHSLEIDAADFVTPADGTYHIKGLSGHDHTIHLTAAQLTAIAGGTPVTVTSSFTGHDHVVTVVCG